MCPRHRRPTAMPPPIPSPPPVPAPPAPPWARLPRNDRVGDGRRRVILEGDTAADAVATGTAAGPGTPIAVLRGQRAVAQRDSPVAIQDAAADAGAAAAAPLALLLMICWTALSACPGWRCRRRRGGVAAHGGVGQTDVLPEPTFSRRPRQVRSCR